MDRRDDEAQMEMDQPFTIRMRGYDKDEVDLYISQLFGELDSAAAHIEELKKANPVNPEDVLGAEVQRVLKEARELATNVSGDAEEQASGMVDKAREDSKRMLDDAKARSEARTADARERAERMITNARSEAETIVADARARVESLKEGETEIRSRLEEAIKATQAVISGVVKHQPSPKEVDVARAESKPARPPRHSETPPIDLTRSQEEKTGPNK
jgi:DivIVA domain-containing protein